LVNIPPIPEDWDPNGNYVVFSLDDLTDGGIYEVISVERYAYRILDDSGEDYLYDPGIFEIVEALPAPPVLTEEDFRQGRSGMYVATDGCGNRLHSTEYPMTDNAGAVLEVAETEPAYGGAR